MRPWFTANPTRSQAEKERALIELFRAATSPGPPVAVSSDDTRLPSDMLDRPLVPGCASAEVNGLSYDELRQACSPSLATPGSSASTSWRSLTNYWGGRLGCRHSQP